MIFKFIDTKIDNPDYKPSAHEFDRVQIQFPELDGTSTMYQFASFSLANNPSEDAAKNANILQIGFDSMYDLVNFAQEIQKTLDYAMVRAIGHIPVTQPEAESEAPKDEVSPSQAD